MTDKASTAPAAGSRVPIHGMCVCDHNEPAHTQIDLRMRRIFPGQSWNGCTQCGCPFFRQEDQISVGLRDGTLRVVMLDDEPEASAPQAPAKALSGDES